MRNSFAFRAAAAGAAAALVFPCATAQLGYVDSIEVAEAHLGVERVAVNFMTPYVSMAASDNETRWVQIDLGQPRDIDGVKILPPAEGWGAGAVGFPALFDIEVSDDPEFKTYTVYEDRTNTDDFPDPGFPEFRVVTFSGTKARGRYVRFTATKLRSNRLSLTKIMVLSGGRDVAEGCKVTESHSSLHSNPGILTRPPRGDGEYVVTDHPENVIPREKWHPVKIVARVPRGGVRLKGGVFEKVFNNNIDYLMNQYTYEELVRNFKLKAGMPVQPMSPRFKAENNDFFWQRKLPGSNAGRFLMGAGNSVRWTDNAALRKRLDDVVSLIDSCKEPDGYIMAYPKHTIFCGERGGYTRSWVTQGLIEAGFGGSEKAFRLLGGFSKWLDSSPYLPELFKRGWQGIQGMIPFTRTYFTPVGRPEDIYVAQRHYQLNFWMDSLAARNPRAIYKFEYERPHNYLVTTLEAYMDLYLATGDKRYLDAVSGGYDLFHDNWEHIGGSLAINEGEFVYAPKSYWLTKETGELCGNSFWVRLNQRYHMIWPQEEKYVAEIEKSLYNVIIPNQVGGTTIRYFARLTGHKHPVQPYAQNTCCEGQGTRTYGTLPEHIWSVGSGSVWVNLFAPSTIDCEPGGGKLQLEMKTAYPYDTRVEIDVKSTDIAAATTLCIRVPYWAQGKVRVRVNGKAAATGTPASFLALKRKWKAGDKVSFEIPAAFTATKYAGAEEAFAKSSYAIQHAGLMLAVVNKRGEEKFEIAASPRNIASKLSPIEGKPMHFTVAGSPDLEVMPYFEVQDEAFTCFPTLTARQ